METHLGVKLMRGRRDFYLNRENYIDYASVKPSLGLGTSEYSKERIDKMIKNALVSYDVNMEHFESLDKDEFESEVNRFLKTYPEFKEFEDISCLKGKSGYYVMIFDKYKQVYVGTSKDILKRIRQHWMATKPLDRLVLGEPEKSILPVDVFRAKDNTRVLTYITDDVMSLENKYLNFFRNDFTLNRVSGGIDSDGLLLISNTRRRSSSKRRK